MVTQHVKNERDVRLSIYEFQKQIDAEDLLFCSNNTNTAPTTPVREIEQYNCIKVDDVEYEQYKAEKRKLKAIKAASTATSKKSSSKSKDNNNLFGEWANRLFFITPKPARPQLHAFF